MQARDVPSIRNDVNALQRDLRLWGCTDAQVGRGADRRYFVS